jgi:hypothetical protein
MLRYVAVVALAFGFSNLAVASAPVFIADGDCNALSSAISSAGPTGETTIMLARRGTYAHCGISVQHGRVRIEGGGATFGASRQCSSPIVDVAAGAALTLRNTTIAGPTCRSENAGDTEFEAVTVFGGSADLTIDNVAGATLTLRNVTAIPGVHNAGTLNLYNSTLAPGGIADEAGSQQTLSNSIVWTFPTGFVQYCVVRGSGAVHSLGGNLLQYGCPWVTAADRQTAALFPDYLGLPADNGGLVPTERLLTSVAQGIGIGVAKYCEATDARGKTRPAGACDAGAYEVDAGAEPITGGGINGAFYDAGADGHYVTIQRLQDDNVLIFWNTFDHNGAPAWVYGVGVYSDGHLHADMSQNINGHLQPGGPATGATARSWGTVDIDMASCDSGTLRYASTLTAFGSGQFPLNRLAHLSDLSCGN